MTRNQLILKHFKPHGLGLEIGPSINPITPKKKGYNVHIVDHSPAEQLRDSFKKLNQNISNIEEVDFVWKGESYRDLIGCENIYDWVVASHVIEHVPNIAGFINNCSGILKDDGILCLAVPDKRFCFDSLRPISTLASIIDAHFNNHIKPSIGAVVDFKINMAQMGGAESWHSTSSKHPYTFRHNLEEVKLGISKALDNEYQDVHTWTFTPSSFRLIIKDLSDLGIIELRELDFTPTNGFEFFIQLSRNGSGPNKSRLEFLKEIDNEQKISHL